MLCLFVLLSKHMSERARAIPSESTKHQDKERERSCLHAAALEELRRESKGESRLLRLPSFECQQSSDPFHFRETDRDCLLTYKRREETATPPLVGILKFLVHSFACCCCCGGVVVVGSLSSIISVCVCSGVCVVCVRRRVSETSTKAVAFNLRACRVLCFCFGVCVCVCVCSWILDLVLDAVVCTLVRERVCGDCFESTTRAQTRALDTALECVRACVRVKRGCKDASALETACQVATTTTTSNNDDSGALPTTRTTSQHTQAREKSRVCTENHAA